MKGREEKREGWFAWGEASRFLPLYVHGLLCSLSASHLHVRNFPSTQAQRASFIDIPLRFLGSVFSYPFIFFPAPILSPLRINSSFVDILLPSSWIRLVLSIHPFPCTFYFSCTTGQWQLPLNAMQRQPLRPQVSHTSSAPNSNTHPKGAVTVTIVGLCSLAAASMRWAQSQYPLISAQRQRFPHLVQGHFEASDKVAPAASSPLTSIIHPQGVS